MANQRKSEAEMQEIRKQRHESRTNTTYQTFINELCAPGDMSKGEAECASVAVLQALEKRILPGEAKDLESQLPLKLQELLEHARIGEEAPQRFGKETLIEMVASDLDTTPEEAESIARRVFATVRSQISLGEAEDVEAELPPDIADLWRTPPV